MLSKLSFSVLLVFSLANASAQKIKSQTAFSFLQTANTLMEAQQLDAAEEFFKKGLEKARTYNDVYCQAYGNQGLGTLYTKLDQQKKAIDCYQLAIKLYRNQRLPMIANVVESLLKSVQGIGDIYAGIEVGAKGVKLCIIDVKLSKDRQYDYTLMLDTAINTDAASLSYQSEKETFDAMTLLWGIIKNRYKIPAKQLYAVISSGLKQELDKYNKIDYYSYIIKPKDPDFSAIITSVSPIEESELSILGIVPQKDRYTASQIDVGSGNTKGGYFNSSRKLVPVTFPLGTKSFQRLIDAREKGGITQFNMAAEQLWKDSIAATIQEEFKGKDDFKSRDVVYLSGGIVWAIASLMHPAEIQKSYVEISSNDVSEFRHKLINNYEELTQPTVLGIANSEDAEAARKTIGRVLKTYDQRALTAGAICVDELVKQVNTINPNKKFIYSKYAYIGWISGYIIKKATQQYTGLVSR